MCTRNQPGEATTAAQSATRNAAVHSAAIQMSRRLRERRNRCRSSCRGLGRWSWSGAVACLFSAAVVSFSTVRYCFRCGTSAEADSHWSVIFASVPSDLSPAIAWSTQEVSPLPFFSSRPNCSGVPLS